MDLHRRIDGTQQDPSTTTPQGRGIYTLVLTLLMGLWLGVALASCSGSSIERRDGGDLGLDGSGETADALGEIDLPDILPFDGKLDAADAEDDAPDAEETSDADVITEGGFLWPCKENIQCDSGWCIDTLEYGQVCTVSCYDECPQDWICVVGQTMPDLEYICVPPSESLCERCETDADCPGEAGRCVGVGADEDLYCSYLCADSEDCLPDYSCAASGDEQVCLPDTGSCVCTPELDGSERACFVDNELGKCFGTEVCDGAAGWTECSARVPEAEICDGFDNDCNGFVDEGYPDYDEDGALDCLDADDDDDGDPDTTDCAPLNAAIFAGQLEACDGVDNNCSGGIDEGYPDHDDDGVADCLDPDDDNDGDPDSSDCRPFDATIYTGHFEACDGVDNNCSGEIDEGYPDNDDDGAADCIDADDDNDNVLDEQDNCPFDANPTQADADGDTIGDACDADADNDGILDDGDSSGTAGDAPCRTATARGTPATTTAPPWRTQARPISTTTARGTPATTMTTATVTRTSWTALLWTRRSPTARQKNATAATTTATAWRTRATRTRTWTG